MRIFLKKKTNDVCCEGHDMTVPKSDSGNVRTSGFPLVPDGYHLKHVGKTVQGNGYWIDVQLAIENGGTRNFVAAYVFDGDGNLISSEVVDCGLRTRNRLRRSTKLLED